MDSNPFIYGNKPFGTSTQSSNARFPSYADWLTHSSGKKLFACNRLDNETTGAIVFANSEEGATAFNKSRAAKRAKFDYLFVTDRKPHQHTWTHSSPLENETTRDSLAAVTHFEVVDNSDTFFVVRAHPETDSTHQIRKHAQASKVPLLGDPKFGGTRFPFFSLHCEKIEILELGLDHKVAPPLLLTQLALYKKPLLAQWLMSIDRRQRLYGNTASTVRWIHDENTPLRLDLLGGKGCAGWWRETAPDGSELEQFEELMGLLNISEWRLMHYSGQRQRDRELANTLASPIWTGAENTLNLEFRNESGLSCGLFLDQRENRKWIGENSRGKTVLNLFAYTGAFSVAAAQGGAAKVTTVDLSKNYIDWTKKNFTLNELPVETHAFYDMDTLDYLKYARKKELSFDVIVCDPPSFSRDKKGRVFRVEKDFPELLSAACTVLTPGGILLFSNNYEKWTASRWVAELERVLSGKDIEITEKLNFGWDFETHHERHMKAFLLRKK